MVRDIFQEVTEILYNYHQVSYHVFCSVGNERWSENNSLIRFTVYFLNDQGNGSEWEEEWYIDEEGIHTEEKLFKTLEEFKSDWW